MAERYYNCPLNGDINSLNQNTISHTKQNIKTNWTATYDKKLQWFCGLGLFWKILLFCMRFVCNIS